MTVIALYISNFYLSLDTIVLSSWQHQSKPNTFFNLPSVTFYLFAPVAQNFSEGRNNGRQEIHT